ncbi:MAG: FAD-dependent oxidoreductase [Dehalococcoidales bacterium]
MKTGNAGANSYDVVVIGGGASGLAAALTAAEGGAKVALFEKMRFLGGSSNFAEGMFAVESEMQRKIYMNYSRDDAFRAMMDYSHWRANPRLVRAFIDASAGTIDWLQRQGVEFIEAMTNLPDGLRTVHILKGPSGARGSPMIKTLAARAKEKGATIFTGTPVRQLIRRGKDGVTGVSIERDGKQETISAGAVIIASGGYGNNQEWIKKYCGLDLGVNLIPVRNYEKTGDGIRMAWESGAAEEGMGVLHFFRAGPFGPGARMMGHLECSGLQPYLWVNRQGERFCDETVAFNDSYMGNTVARLKEGYSYSIFDEAARRNMTEHGIDKYVGYKNMPGTRLTDLDVELKAALSKKNPDVAVAGSIEELAQKTGIDPAELKKTLDEYNGYCVQGRDPVFAKAPRYLRPLKEPPFYAVKAYTVFLGSLGGIKINHNMEVVDKKGGVIPGLYAVGTDAGGLYGDTYCFLPASGTTLGFALNSGRIAGKNALEYIKS